MNRARVKVNESPIFFNRGPSAAARLLFFSLLSLAAMVADYRFSYLANIRQVVSTVLYPFERVIVSPIDVGQAVTSYLAGQDRILKENTELKRRLTEQSAEAQR